METHRRLNDEQFETRFANLEFVPTHFTHEAHLRLAWIHVRKYGVEQAVKNIHQQISAFTKENGADDNFHATVTEAAVRAVYHFTLKSEESDFVTFINKYPALKTEFKELLGSHYSFNIFSSAKAKHEFLEPDLAAFD